MLKKLIIQNYVLIPDLEVDFSEGLNILTGETGAGKSIILSALQMATGTRADHSVFLDPDKKCIVELHYDISNFKLEEKFQEAELDYDEQLIIRREILPTGKSRSFVNDSVASLSSIKNISKYLIDFHRQFDNMDVQDIDFHRSVIDILANNNDRLEAFKVAYTSYNKLQTEIQKLRRLDANNSSDLDYVSFQYKELDEANLDPIEITEKEEAIRIMSSSEELKSKFSFSKAQLTDDDQSCLEMLRSIYQQTSGLESISEETKEFSNRLDAAIDELEDLSGLVNRILDSVEYDPELLNSYQERLNVIYRLQNKYKLNSIEELIQLKDQMKLKLDGIAGYGEQIKKLEEEAEVKKSQLTKLSQELRKSRQAVIPNFEKEIIKILESLAFKNVQFTTDLKPLDGFNEFGEDQIEFLFSSNQGKAPQSINRIASGGEVSRLMLSIKSIIADRASLPILVFDEIDTGISGDVAMKTGNILKAISSKHQIISITHSPQVASRADQHFKIYKEDIKGRTLSKLKTLDKQGRTEELAVMLSGSPPSQSALQNAKELILS